MSTVNQNTAATDGKSFPKTGKKLPDAPNGGGTPPVDAALNWKLIGETREHLAEIDRHILREPGFGEVRP